MSEGVSYDYGKKFDIQLGAAKLREHALGEILGEGRIELKTETYQWEETNNLCIEIARDGHPSGLATTEADVWVHELRKEDRTMVWMMFEVERLRELCDLATRAGMVKKGGGDQGRSTVVKIPIDWLFKGPHRSER